MMALSGELEKKSKVVSSRWPGLAVTINEALEDTMEMMPLISISAKLSCYLGTPKGWRVRPFYAGDTFIVNSCRLGKRENLLFKLTPVTLTETMKAEGVQYAEADIATMATIFGQSNFDHFCCSTIGMTMKEAIETTGMVALHEVIAPVDSAGITIPKVTLESMEGFGDF